MKKKVLSILTTALIAVFLLLVFNTPAKAEPARGIITEWEYTITGGVVTLTDYIGTSADIVVPAVQDFIDQGVTTATEVHIGYDAIHAACYLDAESFVVSENGDKVIYDDATMKELFAFLNSVSVDDIKGKRFSELNANDIFDNALVKVDISNLDTSIVTDMSNMFIGAFVLEEVDLYGIDTSNVTDMNGMFSFCAELENLDISTFDTSNVEYMEFIFSDCGSLTSLDVSNFKTDAVIDAEGMFAGCSSLTSLNLGKNFTMKNARSIRKMFMFLDSLETLDVSMMDTSNVMFMLGLFANSPKLKSLDLTNFNTENADEMDSMFEGCEALTEIDLSSFTIDKTDFVTDMCLNSGLKRIYYSAKSKDLPSRYEEMAFDGEFILVQDNPPTGDSNSFFIYGAMIALAIAVMAVAVGLRKRAK